MLLFKLGKLAAPSWIISVALTGPAGMWIGYQWAAHRLVREQASETASPMLVSATSLKEITPSRISNVNATPFSRPTPFIASETLGPGDRVPQIMVEGWLNSSPPEIHPAGNQVVVLDIWANWCPFCRATAPSLVKLFDKYRDRGVQFVSVTNEPMQSVEPFVVTLGIPWPSGFGASLETLQNLGAATSEAIMPGYQVKPTLYVVGRNGRVVWSDEHMRYRHEPPAAIAEALEDAIEDALESTMGAE